MINFEAIYPLLVLLSDYSQPINNAEKDSDSYWMNIAMEDLQHMRGEIGSLEWGNSLIAFANRLNDAYDSARDLCESDEMFEVFGAWDLEWMPWMVVALAKRYHSSSSTYWISASCEEMQQLCTDEIESKLPVIQAEMVAIQSC